MPTSKGIVDVYPVARFIIGKTYRTDIICLADIFPPDGQKIIVDLNALLAISSTKGLFKHTAFHL